MRNPGKLLADKVWAQLTKPRKQLSHHVNDNMEIRNYYGHHVSHHVCNHVGHHNVILTLCEDSERLLEWKSESITNALTDDGRTGVGARDACASKY